VAALRSHLQFPLGVHVLLVLVLEVLEGVLGVSSGGQVGLLLVAAVAHDLEVFIDLVGLIRTPCSLVLLSGVAWVQFNLGQASLARRSSCRLAILVAIVFDESSRLQQIDEIKIIKLLFLLERQDFCLDLELSLGLLCCVWLGLAVEDGVH